MAPAALGVKIGTWRIGNEGRFSQGVVHSMVFQTAVLLCHATVEPDLSSHALDIFSQIKDLLAEAGTDKSCSMTTNIRMVDAGRS